MIPLLFILLGLFYLLFILTLSLGLLRLTVPEPSEEKPYVSVIIAARNEQSQVRTCLKSLRQQSYPVDRYQVILVDDHSEDDTAAIATDVAKEFVQLTVVELEDSSPDVAPKKAALQLGISLARGEIILTTDADCHVPQEWIETIIANFASQVRAVASWLVVEENSSLMSKIEALDSLGFVLVGAATIGLGCPVLANGANFAYRKQAFLQANGFGENGFMGSGDDDLLLQNLSKTGPNSIRFACDPKAIVTTPANPNLVAFLRQRIRWASKARAYPRKWILMQIMIFLMLGAIPLGLLLALLGLVPLEFPLALLVLKLSADWLFMKRGAKMVSMPLRLHHFLLAELFQILYLIVVAPWGFLGMYTWKGRSFRYGKRRT